MLIYFFNPQYLKSFQQQVNIYLQMEREIHRLQQLISDKDEVIKRLTNSNNQLISELNIANKQIENMKEKAISNFSYQHVPDRQIIQTLQAKIASSAWNILELQKINSNYEQCIIKLQEQIFLYQRQLTLIQTKQNQQTIIDSAMEQEMKNNHIMEAWEAVLDEKEKLIDENLALKQKLKERESETAQKMDFFLNEVSNLSEKIKNQHINEKTRLSQFQNNIKELKKENQVLRQTLSKKNQQIMAFYQQSKMISTTKAEDLHTIRNLRTEIKKKYDQFVKLHTKVNQAEKVKMQLIQYHDSITNRVIASEKISEDYILVKKENGILKEKIKIQEKRTLQKQSVIQEANKKMLELLTENQACHELLYEARGYNNAFMEDIEKKVQNFLRAMEKRRENCSQWLDVGQLLAVNQRLRSQNFVSLQQ